MNIQNSDYLSRWPFLPYLLIAGIAAAIYGSSLTGWFLMSWDDNGYVVQNTAAHGFSLENIRVAFSSYYVGNYAPVQIISYMLDHTFWGMNAFGYRLTNLFLHMANGMLFYLLVAVISGRRSIALIAALIFVSHPVQVENVAWISQRKTLLAMLFSLLSLLSYARYRDRSEMHMYILSLAAFALALLSKSVAVIVPVALFAYDVCILGEKPSKRNILDKLPYLICAAVCVVLALYSQQAQHGGGRTAYHGGSPYATFLSMLPVFMDYIRMIFWPSGLSAYYDVTIRKVVDLASILSAAGIAALTAGWFSLFRRNRALFFWGALFVLGLLPVSQIVPIVTLKNDRYLYFPMLGASCLLAYGFMMVYDSLKGRIKPVIALAAAILLVVLASFSTLRATVWDDQYSLWKDAVSKNPGSWYVWEGLAEAYHYDNRYDEARQAYYRALGIEPSIITLNNLAILYRTTGNVQLAVQMLEMLVKLHPNFVPGYVTLGKTYIACKDYERAGDVFFRLKAVKDGLPQAFLGLAGIDLATGELDSADVNFKGAMAAGASKRDVYFGMASLASLRRNIPKSLEFLEQSFNEGFLDFEALMSDDNLKAVRGDREFGSLVKKYLGREAQ